MNGRGGVVTFFIFLFLSIVIPLQILIMVVIPQVEPSQRCRRTAFGPWTIGVIA